MAGAGYDIYEYGRRGMLRDLREALEGGAKADEYQAYDGSTAMVMAARQGHGQVVRLLLEHGADAKVRTDEGSTMLHHAVSGGSPQAVTAILAKAIDVNEPNEEGVTPMLLAVHADSVVLVRMLCDAGADINTEADGWGTPLDGARGEVEKLLTSLGAVRSEAGADQPLAAAAERYAYGCFDTGENPHVVPIKAPKSTKTTSTSARPKAGDFVKLRRPKAGMLQEGDVGQVVEDDGSDFIPLKVAFDGKYDYYDTVDVIGCVAPVALGPDSDRATVEGTRRFLAAKMEEASIATLGSTGLSISPVGFGCHRVEDSDEHRGALELAVTLGCNFIDLAPNYTDGVAEEVAGKALRELIDGKKVRRDEIVVATKVGNVLGRQLAHVEGVSNMATVSDNLRHCIAPEWIEQEVTRSLERLQLSCVDCVLLHCPEYETKAEGVDMAEVYRRLGTAFKHLETEVARGRVAMYGISAAFFPLRPTDAEHLDLNQVLAQLPEKHHFRVLQFPLNYAEAQNLWVGHAERNAEGIALDQEQALAAPTLFELKEQHGLATLINRPLDGIYKESHGVLRFSSLDCDVRSHSELQLDNCDVLETKLTKACQLSRKPWNMGDGAAGQLAAKTVKTLASLAGVDCVLLGMRQPAYVVGTLPHVLNSPPVPQEAAYAAVRSLHTTVNMWFATAIHENDHGTSKDWRLPINSKWVADEPSVGG